MTLDEAVARALDRSPQMAQSQQQVINAEESQRTAFGSFFPTVSSSYSSSVRSSQRFDPNTDRVVSGSTSATYNAGLSARYTLFDGTRFAGRDQARANVQAARARAVDQEAAVVFQTKNLYIQALRQIELLEVARARLEEAGESLALTQRQAQLGTATVSDTLRARLELVNARQSELEAEAGVRNSQVSLGRQVGIAGPVVPAPLDDLEPEPLPVSADELLTLAEQAAPTVVAAEASTRAAEEGVATARAAWFPSFNVNSGLSWTAQDLAFDDNTRSWNVNFSMSYPLFNGFQRESSIARARETYDVTRLQEQDARLVAREEADAALQNLRTAERAIEIAGEALAVAQEDLRVVRERYRVGVARIFDVVVSQVALDQARVDLVQARYDYVLARAELESVIGREL